MEIQIKQSTVIKPAEETPKQILWSTNMDVVASRVHVSLVSFYKRNGSNDFFNTQVLREALSKVLVPFYPVAGRLGFDQNGRIQVNCNGEGVSFIEAQTSNTSVGEFLVDLYAPNSKINGLVPSVDYSTNVSSYPLLLIQVTFFKCGGVCVGTAIHHALVDGISTLHFINSWSELARGKPLTVEPIFDHELLRARDPPTPIYHHIEFDQCPILRSIPKETEQVEPSPMPTSISIFKITPNQIQTLKSKVRNGENPTSYSNTFEVLAAHIWHSVCKSRDLEDDAETSLYFPVEGRNRFHPPLPPGYFGNVIFKCRLSSLGCDIESEPLTQTVKRIHELIKQRDAIYLRSAIDYLELSDGKHIRGNFPFTYPNLHVVSWATLPLYKANFGWGKPIYFGPSNIYIQGAAFILRSATDDGSLLVIIGLETIHIKLFEKHFMMAFEILESKM